MATLTTQKVPVAASNLSKLDVSSTHITSASFMQLQPVYYRHMIPGEHIKGQGNVLSRLAPVALPTYGKCRINMRSFFVPFRTVFPKFNEFITDTIASNVNSSSLVIGSPIVTASTIWNMFNSYTVMDSSGNYVSLMSAISGWTAGDPYDFYDGSDHFELSYYGRRFKKVLESLGYRVMPASKVTADFTWSALPLLCFARIYTDWYSNQNYLNSATYLVIQQLFEFNDPTSQLVLSASHVGSILEYCYLVCYDGGNNVYLNAWDSPTAPNPGNFSLMTGYDITTNGYNPLSPASSPGNVQMSSNGTPVMEQLSASSTYLGTTYLHTFLKSLTDYVKRNQLTGAAAVDRLLSRFGINVDSAKVNRSIYVSEQSVDIDFGSVMQTVDTSTGGNPSNLGDYAGQGLGRGQFGFDYKCDEFGMFIVNYSIVPDASLYQGYDRNNLHISKTSFFTPEFDNLGVEAISKGEVYVSPSHTYCNASTPNLYLGLFGFAPQYYEYKQSKSFVTGDITSPLAYRGGDAWHLFRELDDSSFLGGLSQQVHSLRFTRGQDAESFDRIFNNTLANRDKFYLVFHFAAEALSPCKSLFETYDFDSAAKMLKLDANGAKVN